MKNLCVAASFACLTMLFCGGCGSSYKGLHSTGESFGIIPSATRVSLASTNASSPLPIRVEVVSRYTDIGWRVVEGDTGGHIEPQVPYLGPNFIEALYTPPATPGIYHVEVQQIRDGKTVEKDTATIEVVP